MKNEFNLIAAVDRNWSIGRKDRLLASIPRDRQLFLNETLGKTIVMGRRTFESLPGRQPLYGRENIVLSRDKTFSPQGVTLMRSLEETLAYLGKRSGEQIYVIGGESIYGQFLPLCTAAHITYMDYAYDGDRFLPDLGKDRGWEMITESEEETYFDIPYTFRFYRRK